MKAILAVIIFLLLVKLLMLHPLLVSLILTASLLYDLMGRTRKGG